MSINVSRIAHLEPLLAGSDELRLEDYDHVVDRADAHCPQWRSTVRLVRAAWLGLGWSWVRAPQRYKAARHINELPPKPVWLACPVQKGERLAERSGLLGANGVSSRDEEGRVEQE